jgi:hypothetical protein
MVPPDIVATRPEVATCRTLSGMFQWERGDSRQLASRGLNLNDQFWGEKPGGDPGVSAHPDRPGALQRSAFATC